MQQLRVMVVTPDSALSRDLAERLSKKRFTVIDLRPGPEFVDVAYRCVPDIAILDRIEQRRGSAMLEISILKKRRANMPIIVTSGESSEAEASIIEQGVFFYFAGRSRRDLARLVLAAARTLGGGDEAQADLCDKASED